MTKKLAVVALGGNALLRGDQIGTIDEKEQNTTDTLENLLFLLKEGYDLVITEAFKLADMAYGSKITMEYEDDRR